MDLTAFNSYLEMANKTSQQFNRPLNARAHDDFDKHLIGESLPAPKITPRDTSSVGSIGESNTAAREDHVHAYTLPNSIPFTDGTVGSPGLYVDDDTNTGIYSPSADQIGVATGGLQGMLVTSNETTIPKLRASSNGSGGSPALEMGVTGQNVGFYRTGTDIVATSGSTDIASFHAGHEKLVLDNMLYPSLFERGVSNNGLTAVEGSCLHLKTYQAGICFDSTSGGIAQIRWSPIGFLFQNNAGTGWVALNASAFTVSSSIDYKKNVKEFLPVSQFNRHLSVTPKVWDEKDVDKDALPVTKYNSKGRVGFVVEDLLENYKHATMAIVDNDGHIANKAYDPNVMVAELWNTVTELILKVRELENERQ